jgi:hypothetical protein
MNWFWIGWRFHVPARTGSAETTFADSLVILAIHGNNGRTDLMPTL